MVKSKNFYNEIVERGYYNHFGKKNDTLSLKFKMQQLFDDINFKNKRVLDIGGGIGICSFYAALKGAKQVICIEPELEGSNDIMKRAFNELKNYFNYQNVSIQPIAIQEFKYQKPFDIIISKNSINHLDEPSCSVLHKDREAIKIYVQLFKELYKMLNPSGILHITDCSRKNFWPSIHLKNPIARSIDWEIHQSPTVWTEIARKAGFQKNNLSWNSLPQLGLAGDIFLGNKIASYFLTSQFTLNLYRPK